MVTQQQNPMLYSILTDKGRIEYYRAMHSEDLEILDMKVLQVCRYFNIKLIDLLSKKRNKPLPWARFILMHYMRNTLRMTLTSIGRYFNRDHSTVIYSIESYNDLAKFDKAFQKIIDKI